MNIISYGYKQNHRSHEQGRMIAIDLCESITTTTTTDDDDNNKDIPTSPH